MAVLPFPAPLTGSNEAVCAWPCITPQGTNAGRGAPHVCGEGVRHDRASKGRSHAWAGVAGRSRERGSWTRAARSAS
jgi:hypothetical protein